MKLVAILLLLAVALAEEQYTAEHDDLDIEAVVSDEARLKAFHGCFIDTAPCDEVQGSFKKDLNEAIQQSCAKCTPAQKHILRRFLEGLKEKFPQDYADFQKKFDPESKYFTKLESAIADA